MEEGRGRRGHGRLEVMKAPVRNVPNLTWKVGRAGGRKRSPAKALDQMAGHPEPCWTRDEQRASRKGEVEEEGNGMQ